MGATDGGDFGQRRFACSARACIRTVDPCPVGRDGVRVNASTALPGVGPL